MKKSLIFILYFFLIFYLGKAQEIDFGPKIGVNFENFGDLEQYENQLGFVGGAFLSIKFKRFSIQPELLYSQQGTEFDFTAFDLGYINLPLIFKFKLVGGLNFQLGPQFGLLVNNSIPESIATAYNTGDFDTAGNIGLGIDLPLRLRISTRYVFNVENNFRLSDLDNGFFTLALGVSLF